MTLVVVANYGLVYLVRLYAARSKRKTDDYEWDDRAMEWRPAKKNTLTPPRHRDAEMRLLREFREIVREPLPDPHDPRFKTWNPRERFPWGWAYAQYQLDLKYSGENRPRDIILG